MYTPTPEVLAQIERTFKYHAPHSNQPERYMRLRDAARALAERIVNNTPPSREQSLALTKLEEALFFANAGIARNESEQIQTGSG